MSTGKFPRALTSSSYLFDDGLSKKNFDQLTRLLWFSEGHFTSQSGRKGISAFTSLKVDSSFIACPLTEIKLLYSTNMKDPKGILKATSSKAEIGLFEPVFGTSIKVH